MDFHLVTEGAYDRSNLSDVNSFTFFRSLRAWYSSLNRFKLHIKGLP